LTLPPGSYLITGQVEVELEVSAGPLFTGTPFQVVCDVYRPGHEVIASNKWFGNIAVGVPNAAITMAVLGTSVLSSAGHVVVSVKAISAGRVAVLFNVRRIRLQALQVGQVVVQ